MSFIFSIIGFFSSTNITSIVCSIIASLVFEGSKSVFVHIWKEKTKGVDERMRKYFERAVDKLVLNETIARELKTKSYPEYLKAVKEKLKETKSYDKSTKLFNDIVEEFSKLAQEDPTFMIQMLWKYQRLIKKQENEIQEELRKVGEKIDAQTKLLQRISTNIENFKINSQYKIPPIVLNDSNAFQLEGYICRDKLVSDICGELQQSGCVILYGDILIGKSTVAKLVGLANTKLAPLLIQLNYKDQYNIRSIITDIKESDSIKLIIIDDLPDYDTLVVEDLFSTIQIAIKKGIQILITTRDIGVLPIHRYGFIQHLIPPINVEELEASVPQCKKKLAELIVSASGGYPTLVNLLLIYLNVNNWTLSEKKIIDFISIPNKKDVQDYVSKKIREIITNAQDLQLLSRLSLFWRPFTDADVVALADVNPIIITPKTKLANLLSQRLLIREGEKLELSPFIKKVWSADLVGIEYRECSNMIIERLIRKHTIDTLDMNYAILLLCNAGEYERAGYFYATCLQKCIEIKNLDSSQVFYLTMLWRDMPLPKEMSLTTKTLIRILQIQLANMTNVDCSYALKDLFDFIKNLPTSSPLKSTASCFAIANLSDKGRINDALSLLPYALPTITSEWGSEYIELARDQKEMANKLPVLMLANIANLDGLLQWFEKIEQTNMTVECIDVDAVKFVFNKITTESNTEEVLMTIINRVDKNVTFQIFLIVAVARLMLFRSDKKRYSECKSLFDQYKHLSTIDIGKVMMCNALACCYNDSGDKDRALDLWEKVCSNNSFNELPDEIMLASINAAYIHCNHSHYGKAVNCIESIVTNDAFITMPSKDMQMRMRGELAIAYWNNDQKNQTFEQLMIIHNYLYNNQVDSSDNDQYKLLELKFGICVQQYYYYLDKGVFDSKCISPQQTIFYYPNSTFLQAYNSFRKGTNIMYLYMMAALLKIDEQLAYEVGVHAIDCFSSFIKEKHIAFGLLNELNPLMLQYNEYDKVEYLTKSTLALATDTKDIPNPLDLLLYFPLLPLCCKRFIDKLTGLNANIDKIIQSRINEAALFFPEDAEVNALKSCICEQNRNNFTILKNDLVKISVRVYFFEELEFFASINVIIISTMFLAVHKYYGYSLLRQYVYQSAKYIISKFKSNYSNKYKNPLVELDKVQNAKMEDLVAAKKMIKILVCFSHNDISLTKEQETFIDL